MVKEAFLASPGPLELGRRAQCLRQPEIAARHELLGERHALRVAGLVEHGDTGVFDLVGQHEAEQQHLGHRHAEQDQQRAPVAQDVAEFFLNEGEKAVHF